MRIYSLTHPEYRPVFFNRGNEYGRGHPYYEALCHGFTHREVVLASSARYFNSSSGKSLLTKHLPSPIPIAAFIECVRTINSTFMTQLSQTLTSFTTLHPPTPPSTAEDMVSDFLNGTFRNIAIQIHYNASSYERLMLYHMDHVFSALHMAVTLHGRRSVGFSRSRSDVSDFNEIVLDMQAGDVYITTPAGILHGVSVDELSMNDRSVAIQCRTLLGAGSSAYWCKHVGPLCVEIGKVLEKSPLKMPKEKEWRVEYEKLKAGLGEGGKEDVFVFEQEAIAESKT